MKILTEQCSLQESFAVVTHAFLSGEDISIIVKSRLSKAVVPNRLFLSREAHEFHENSGNERFVRALRKHSENSQQRVVGNGCSLFAYNIQNFSINFMIRTNSGGSCDEHNLLSANSVCLSHAIRYPNSSWNLRYRLSLFHTSLRPLYITPADILLVS